MKRNNFLKATQQIIAKNLRVNNPTLIKTGVLGSLVNIISNVKIDSAIYFNKLMKEASPATAEEYKNLFFWGSMKDVPINFSNPALLEINFIIPELTLSNGEVIVYDINANTEFIDRNGRYYTLEEPIKIFVSNGRIQAQRYGSKTEELDIYKAPHPRDNTKQIYLVKTTVRQYQRNFMLVTIPDNLSDSNGLHTINFPIQKDNIYQINAWRQKTRIQNNQIVPPTDLDITEVPNYKSENIMTAFDLQPLDVKFSKSRSNQSDEHIFISFNETNIVFETGNGLNGKAPDPTEKILLEIKSTDGERGNIQSAEFDLSNVTITQTNRDGTKHIDKTSIKAVSIDGASGGSNLEGKESLRRRILDTNGNPLTTMGAIRNEYHRGGEPFIETKFFNSKHNLFIYNVLKEEERIIPSTTKNLLESELEDNPFMPQIEYEGIKLISPFYYIKKGTEYEANLVYPEVKINLVPQIGSDEHQKLANNPSLFMTYDWSEKKTYLELRGINGKYTYEMSCNINSELVFSAGNQFRIEVNKTFLNGYCLFDGMEKIMHDPELGDVKVDGYLTDIKLEVYNDAVDNQVRLITFISDAGAQYTQLKQKQKHYYWIDVDLFDTTFEERYYLNIPFLEYDYVKKDIIKASQKLDSFFDTVENKDRFSTNVNVTQALYNTIKLEDIYRNYVLKTTDVYVDPKIFITMDIDLDQLELQRSDWDNTTALETDIKWLLGEYLSKKEGYLMEFGESLLEREIIDYFNDKYKIISNVKIWNPSGPIRVRSSDRVYNLMDDNFGSEHFELSTDPAREREFTDLILGGTIPKITQKQIVDFVPPYFSFDPNIQINFKFND